MSEASPVGKAKIVAARQIHFDRKRLAVRFPKKGTGYWDCDIRTLRTEADFVSACADAAGEGAICSPTLCNDFNVALGDAFEWAGLNRHSRNTLAVGQEIEWPNDSLGIGDIAELSVAELPKPMQLIDNMLHQGSKFAVGGSSKSNKTWLLIDMALSLSHSAPWLGFKTQRTKVLYCNLEVQECFFVDRIKAVANARGIRIEPGWLDVWNLRGYNASFEVMLPKIQEQVMERKYGMIILDPLYIQLIGKSFQKVKPKTIRTYRLLANPVANNPLSTFEG